MPKDYKWNEVYHCSKEVHNGAELYLCDMTENLIAPTVKVSAWVAVEAVKATGKMIWSVAKLAGETL